MTLPLALLSASAAAAATRELGTATPSATPSGTHRVRPPAGPRLSIGVTDGRTTANVGDQLTYAVSIRNSSPSAVARLTVTLTLPPGVPLVSAGQHGAAGVGKVTWRTTVPAGRADTFRATARVAHPPARMQRLAAVACAAAAGGSKPMVCAADLDRSTAADAAATGAGAQTGSSAGGPTTGYAIGGVAVLAAAALALVMGRRSRSRRRMRHSG